MAVFARTFFANNYIDRVKQGDTKRFKDAMNGDGTESLAAVNQILRNPDFVIKGTTDTNTAALSAGAASSIQVNLSTEGVSFPANTVRRIDILTETRDGALRNFQHIQQWVLGGTDPTLIRGVLNMLPPARLEVTFSSAAATAANTQGGMTVTSAATATGRYAAAFPLSRRAIPTGIGLITDTTIATTPLWAAFSALSATAGTLEAMIIEATTSTAVPQLLAPLDTDRLFIGLDILPVANPELAIVTTTSPDQVVVGAVGESGDVITWHTEVYVSQLFDSSMV